MPKPKSFLRRLQIDHAQRSHNCQHNSAHRIRQGGQRLKVTDGRDQEHFCVPCAIQFLEGDVAKLQSLIAALKAAQTTRLAEEVLPPSASTAPV